MKKTLTIIAILLHTIAFAQNINGIWQSEGYGHLLDISENNMDVYHITQISNIYDDSYDLEENNIIDGDELEGNFTLQGEQLRLTSPGGTIITFNKLGSLPAETEATDDPQINFDIFWQTYQDWCGLFPTVDVNWQAEYDFYDSLINNQTTDEELFSYMSALLANLNDGHSFLDPVNLADFFDGGPAISQLWSEFEYEMMDLIEEFYIDGGNYVFSNSGLLSYGKIQDSIGYLSINSMEGFSNSDTEFDDNQILSEEIDAAMTVLQNTKALIIDVRFNTGGYDSNARVIGNRLTNTAIPVYSKQVRIGGYGEYADSTVFYISPTGVQYLDRPVVVLTSDGTLSAADIFALLAREINCVSLIGEATYGALSDNYTKYLPNEWEFGISPERYKSVDNINYEQLGVPPTIEVTGDMTAFMNNQDNILDVALAEIFGLCNTTAVENIKKQTVIKVYPNPSSDKLTIELNNKERFVPWQIWNAEGKVVMKGKAKQAVFEVELKGLPDGIYTFYLFSADAKIATKFSVN